MNYNPMLDYQKNQLLAQQALIQSQLNQIGRNSMPQGYGQFNPYVQQQPQQTNFFVRQVGTIDEAKSYPVDPGIMYFFLDTGNGKIYLKQLNATGRSDFFTYSIQENVQELKSDPFEQINARLTNIEKIIGGIYDKSISGTSSNEQPNEHDTTADATENAEAKSADVPASPTDDKRKK